MVSLDLNDYDPEINDEGRYKSVLNDNFSNYGWTVSLKIKTGQKIKDSFEKKLTSFKRKLKQMMLRYLQTKFSTKYQNWQRLEYLDHVGEKKQFLMKSLIEPLGISWKKLFWKRNCYLDRWKRFNHKIKIAQCTQQSKQHELRHVWKRTKNMSITTYWIWKVWI